MEASPKNPFTNSQSRQCPQFNASETLRFGGGRIPEARTLTSAFTKGKVLLIVNVASKCGFTDTNYTQLTELYGKYKDKGFEVLAFPCNQFLKQEPGTSEDANEFACTRYKAEYPIFKKIRVNGPNADPVYKFLKASKPGFIGGGRIKWNFTKFLVDKDGNVIERYSPTTSPLNIEADIKKALGEV